MLSTAGYVCSSSKSTGRIIQASIRAPSGAITVNGSGLDSSTSFRNESETSDRRRSPTKSSDGRVGVVSAWTRVPPARSYPVTQPSCPRIRLGCDAPSVESRYSGTVPASSIAKISWSSSHSGSRIGGYGRQLRSRSSVSIERSPRAASTTTTRACRGSSNAPGTKNAAMWLPLGDHEGRA